MPEGRRCALAVMAVALGLLIATDVAAQARILVAPFEHDPDGTVNREITEQLVYRNDYRVAGERRFYDELRELGVTVDDFVAEPLLMQHVSYSLIIDAFIVGRMDRSRRARELILTIVEGATGDELGIVTVEMSGGLPEPESLDWGLAEVESLIAWAAERGPAEVPPDLPVRQRQPSETPSDPSELGDATGVPWMRVGGGIDVVQRNFTLTAANAAGIRYESGFYPGVEGSLALFPVALFSPGVADGLGVHVRIARYFVATQLLDETGGILDIPTRHKELGIGLGYALDLGRAGVDLSVGYEAVAYQLGANPVYESSEYNGLAVSAGGRYAIVSDLLSIGAQLEVRPSPSLSQEEQEAFGVGEAFGYGFGISVAAMPFEFLGLTGFYTLQAFTTTYDGTGTAELDGTLESSDTFQHFGFLLSYYE